MIENEVEKILLEVGLTSQESRVYLALLRLKESKTGRICEETKIASSNIYYILDSLLKKGLIGYKLVNNVKVFFASAPDVLWDIFRQKKEELAKKEKEVKEVISNLKDIPRGNGFFSDYKYFEGIFGVKSMWHEIIGFLDKETLVRIYTSKKESYENMLGFYDEFHKERIRKKSEMRIILPIEDKALGKKRLKGGKDLTKIKFMKQGSDSEWGTAGDCLFLFSVVGKMPKGFLIKDSNFVKTYNEIFDKLWAVKQ